MMKINPSAVIADHLRTLQNGKSKRVSLVDLSVFYIAPALASFLVYWFNVRFSSDVFAQSIAVFAIFSALLFSVQVALFGIFTKRRQDADEYSQSYEKERLVARTTLIRETNSNISYLMVLSSLSVTIFIAAFAVKVTDRFEAPLAVFLYLHFMLTLLMIIKRVHVLFDKEYEFDEF